MNLDLRYVGRSGAVGGGLRFAPNLARPRVGFDGELRDPVRFREAMSALYGVVVGDLKVRPKDRSAHEAFLRARAEEEAEVRRVASDAARRAELARVAEEPVPPNLEADFQRQHGRYWAARRRWARELALLDPALFRALVPCDPVVTVARDVVFFEAFSKDESSYGCVTVERDGLRGEASGLGTTNVDYSPALYDAFQSLRSYRGTRLSVDPDGFGVATAGGDAVREEKIDLPPSWLRGFGRLQAATMLPSRRVPLSVEAVQAVLAFLARHREREGPRSLRIELGAEPAIVIEPWGERIRTRRPADGPEETIRVWGRRRLSVLARLLPFARSFEVRLLGSGLPSLWIADLGEVRFVLALSGWTANDWTGGAALELLAGPMVDDPSAEAAVLSHLAAVGRATPAELRAALPGVREAALRGALHRLASLGQVVNDLGADTIRHRQVMPQALSEALLGPPPAALVAGRAHVAAGRVTVSRDEPLGARRLLVAQVAGQSCEAIVDADGRLSRTRCGCGASRKGGARLVGPCEHLVALNLAAPRAWYPGATT